MPVCQRLTLVVGAFFENIKLFLAKARRLLHVLIIYEERMGCENENVSFACFYA